MEINMKKRKYLLVLLLLLLIVTSTTLLWRRFIKHKEGNQSSSYALVEKSFDKGKTPIYNMMILLRILNASNLCDEQWFKDVEYYTNILKDQIEKNSQSDDESLLRLFQLQSDMITQLEKITSHKDQGTIVMEDINGLETAFNAYKDYYYSN